jgi:hypothetical protein
MAEGLSLTTEVTGLVELLDGLGNLPNDLAQVIQEATAQDLQEAAYLLANYPPAPPGSLYARTGDLGLGWIGAKPQIDGTGLEFSAQINNPVAYTGYVQGGSEASPRQAWMHVGRWQTTDQVMAQSEEKASSRLEQALQEVLSKL